MSGQRKQALELADLVQRWNVTYQSNPTDETKEVHNSLCDVLDDLNAWLKVEEGPPRILGNRKVGPIEKTWRKIS